MDILVVVVVSISLFSSISAFKQPQMETGNGQLDDTSKQLEQEEQPQQQEELPMVKADGNTGNTEGFLFL